MTYLNTILSLGESNNNFISFDIVNTIITNNSILSSHNDFIINDFQQIESIVYSLYTYGVALLITLSIILLLAMYAIIYGPFRKKNKKNNSTNKFSSAYIVTIEKFLIASFATTRIGSGHSIKNLT